MFHSNWFLKHFRTLAASALITALIIAAFFFTGQQSVTVAKAAANTQPMIFQLPSSVQDIVGIGIGNSVQSSAPVLTSYEISISDQGASYLKDIVEIDIGNSVQSSAPVIPSYGSDLGATYLQDIVGIGSDGQSLVPELTPFYPQQTINMATSSVQDIVGYAMPISSFYVQSVVLPQSTYVQTIYLTDGYALLLKGTSGHVVTPSDNTFHVQSVVLPQSTYVQTTYLTDGYVLVLEGTNGHVVTPETTRSMSSR
jgi:hypothetical protein